MESPVSGRPCAAAGLTSYRLRGPFGWIMIGARSDDDAMAEAARSTPAPDRRRLEVWREGGYQPVAVPGEALS